MKRKELKIKLKKWINGALEGIRIPDLLNRNQMLYPAELRAHFKRNVKYSQRFLKSFINFDVFTKISFFAYFIALNLSQVYKISNLCAKFAGFNRL